MSESIQSREVQGGGTYCTTTHLSSRNNFGVKIKIEYDIDESLDIKEEIIQEGNQLEEKYVTTEISSNNNAAAKSLIEYNIEETLNIKEEIVPDQEIHQQGRQNLSKIIPLEKKCITSEISSPYDCGAETLIKYEDETLEVKEEAIQNLENMEQGLHTKYESTFYTLYTREADVMTVGKPQTSTKKKIQETTSEPKKKFTCEKCARSYSQKPSLYKHRKFECDVTPQFRCNLCGKQFKQKAHLNTHVLRVHQKSRRGKHNNLSKTNQLDKKCVTVEISSDRNSGAKTLIKCEEETLEAKEKTIQDQENMEQSPNKKCVSSKLEPKEKYNCEKCARSYSQKRSLYKHKKFECDVTPQFRCNLCSKQFKQKAHLNTHILRVHQKSQRGKQNNLSQINEISSDHNSGAKTLIKYEDETLEGKEESMQDQGNMCSLDTRADIIVEKLQISKKKKIQEPKKKFPCNKCARSYVQKESLSKHQKFECDVTPQFMCNFCDKQFKQKGNFNSHILRVHQKHQRRKYIIETSSDHSSGAKTSIKYEDEILEGKEETIQNHENMCTLDKRADITVKKLQTYTKKILKSKSEPIEKYNCEKCARSYSQKTSLYKHKKFECDVAPQFRCNFCGKQFKRKAHLNSHILRVHQKYHQGENNNLSKINQLDKKCITLEVKEENIQDEENMEQGLDTKYESKKKIIQKSKSESKKKYNCEKCARSYSQKSSLYKHKKFECNLIPQFSCEFCGNKFKQKNNLYKHILRVHEKFQTMYSCDKCSQSYRFAHSLSEHKCLEHVLVKPQFICHFCGHQTKRKCHLSSHITSRHFSKFHGSILERERKYKCEKCARSYCVKEQLYKHKKLVCDITPQFRCNLCSKKCKRKGHLKNHILRIHQKRDLKTSQKRHNCDKCYRSYYSLGGLNEHKHLEHNLNKPQFICDYCSYKTNRKPNLSKHMIRLHS